jgi:hypothetical protein
MNKIENWKDVTKGLYRYVIAPNVCYEIHILHHDHGTDILSAKSNLFIVGDWTNQKGESFMERECLLAENTFAECLEKATKDYTENM